MPETVSTLAAWRIGGQIDESALTGISQFADIVVTATLVGAAGENVVDPTNNAHVLRGPYTTVVGGTAGTATTHPSADGNATLAGRLQFAHSDLSAYSVFEEAFTHGDRAGRGVAAWLRR